MTSSDANLRRKPRNSGIIKKCNDSAEREILAMFYSQLHTGVLKLCTINLVIDSVS